MFILTQFIFRLSFGLALGMTLTDSRQVTSGYYRNHLYVLLGLNVLGTMVALASGGELAVAPPLMASILSYLGSAVWLYEKPRAGHALLAGVSAACAWGALAATAWPSGASAAQSAVILLDPLTSGLVLGFTMAAMFLGHWYLNSPTMAIAPLQNLVGMMAAAIVLRAMVEAAKLAIGYGASPNDMAIWLFIALRWLSGIFGALGLTVMTQRILKIPNTQSATGVLYVAVIVTFLGELASLLLTAQSVSAL